MNNIDKKEERKYSVLGYLVDEYVASATPVSSKVIARSMGDSVSSATVRNIMSELEEAGYIEQPHTSAGRIPTHLGYRHYVNTIKFNLLLKKNAAKRLTEEYDNRIKTMRGVIEKTSFLISHELHNAGMVMWPSINDFYLKYIKLVKIEAETILAILVTMTNAVKNYIVKLDAKLDSEELEKVSNYINSEYEHSSFHAISDDLKTILSGSTDEDSSDLKTIKNTAFSIIKAISNASSNSEISYEGLDYFMDEPEFEDINLTRCLLQIFSERSRLTDMLRNELPFGGLKVYIGSENDYEELSKCAVITCGYRMHDKTVGRIGVIGPVRMNYPRALSTVHHLACVMSSKLDQIEE